jgi:putative acetyltransferase
VFRPISFANSVTLLSDHEEARSAASDGLNWSWENQACSRAIGMTVVIERVAEPTPQLRELIDELNDVLGAAYEAHQRHGLSIAQLFEPHVRFFIARVDDVTAGCSGVALFDDYAEVKRMYTRPSFSGRGLAKALLMRIEAEARAVGMASLYLETGVHQHAAIRLYEGAGFRRCGPFGVYATMPGPAIELSLFYEKPLRDFSRKG